MSLLVTVAGPTRLRSTILISNQTKEELAAFVSERVIDRMSDGGKIIVNLVIF